VDLPNWSPMAGYTLPIWLLPNLPPTFSTLDQDWTLGKNTSATSSALGCSKANRFDRSLYGRQLFSGQKGGAGIGKTKRGKGTKIMGITDRFGVPIAVCTHAANTHEVKLVEKTLESRVIPTLKIKRIIADKAYDSDQLDATLAKRNIELIAPHRNGRKRPATQDGRALRRYKRRWTVERTFAWLHNWRRCVVRYDYYLDNFRAWILIGVMNIYLKRLF
jgi:transposase